MNKAHSPIERAAGAPPVVWEDRHMEGCWFMAKEYVENVDGAYRVAGTRVSLDSIAYCFREGLSPESIAESFTSLTLEQVYGAITFYLANQRMVDEYLREGDKLSRELQAESTRRNADLIARLELARHESQIPG